MNLSHRQEKIQAKRKQTPWREFVRDICSWQNMVLKKEGNIISKYSDTNRSGDVISVRNFIEEDMSDYEESLGEDFFTQFNLFFKSIPKASLMHFGVNENSDYADIVVFAKNAYLSFHVTLNSENVLYSISVKDSCDMVLNSMSISQSKNVYCSRGISQSFNIFYSSVILNSSNLWYCDNCIGCEECIGCFNLTNQRYMIGNIQYLKEEYLLEKKKAIQETLNHGLIGNIDCDGCDGIGLVHCSNIKNGFFTTNIRDSRNVVLASSKETNFNQYDLILGGGTPAEGDYYGGVSCGGCSHVYCSIGMAFCTNCYYSYHLESCSFCLGCIGLKNKSYCILNKQYTKEERYTKVDEIFTQMENTPKNPSGFATSPTRGDNMANEGRNQLGEFFPPSMNPFYFNDTAAYLIDPSFTKEEVTAKGYLRRDEPIKVDIPEGVEIVKTTELGQYEGFITTEKGNEGNNPSGSSIEWIATPTAHNDIQWYIDPAILKKVIQDEQGNVYKIVKMEYDFLMKYGLPLPRKHWLERMKENFRIT